MPKRTFVCRHDRDGRPKMIEVDNGDVEIRHRDLDTWLLHEGTQGESVLNGYRKLEKKGKLRGMEHSADRVKAAWANEVTGRFR